MVTTVFDKTQVWPRKSILSVKSYPDLAVNHLKLIRDKCKIPLYVNVWVLNSVRIQRV